jgi:glycine/D-amino acid oxidase-like deaminating enzyme/nitrite reductase/ring-hydroxylating ferredoxin subunit
MRSDSGDTQSIWMATADPPQFSALAADVDTDVCVVGAGIAGLTTAYLLARAGRRVLVLDDGPVAGGESGRTTAHFTYALDDRYYVLGQLHGVDGARKAAESHKQAIDTVEAIVEREGIDCEWERVDGYLFLSPKDDPNILRKELEACGRLGLAEVTRVERAPLASFDTGPALRFPRQGQLHIVKYLAGLARAIVRLGGRICTSTHVTGVEGGARPRVKTEGGLAVTCGAVVAATNSPITDYVVTHVKQAPYRTYVIALRVPRGSVPPGLYWDTPDPYHYVRLARLDEREGPTKGEVLSDALVVGGEDHKTGQRDDMAERFRCLEDWARERFPTAREVLYRWSGQVMEPFDYLAFIGPNPDGAENIYLVTGDSGNGMTHGTIAGLLLTDLIRGQANPWASLYDPKRLGIHRRSVTELAKENLNVFMRYAEWLTPGEVSSVDEIRAGTGAVIRRGTHKVAAYRDERGTLHEVSAVCTHLYCIVNWNSAEKTWDCPCHGSRFDPYGKVLNGPAINDLGPAGKKA